MKSKKVDATTPAVIASLPVHVSFSQGVVTGSKGRRATSTGWPAVPREEPVRLPLPQRHRRALPRQGVVAGLPRTDASVRSPAPYALRR